MPPGEEAAFLAPLPIRRLWGVGEVTRASWRSWASRRSAIWRLSPLTNFALASARTASGCGAPRGIDDSPVMPEHEEKSLSREETFAQDVGDPTLLRLELLRLSESVASRLRRHHLAARTIGLKLRYSDFTTLTRQATLAEPTDSGPVIYAQALALFEATWDRRRLVRLVGVGTSNLEQPARQIRLFEQEDQRQTQLDVALDRIRGRFGDAAIQRAALLENPRNLGAERKAGGLRAARHEVCGTIAAAPRPDHPAPRFRGCAQKLGQAGCLFSQQPQFAADGVGGGCAHRIRAVEREIRLIQLADGVAVFHRIGVGTP